MTIIENISQGLITAVITVLIFFIKEWIQKTSSRRDLAKEQLEKVYSKIHCLSLETYVFFKNEDKNICNDDEDINYREINLDNINKWVDTYKEMKNIINDKIFLLEKKDLFAWRRFVVSTNGDKTECQLADIYEIHYIDLLGNLIIPLIHYVIIINGTRRSIYVTYSVRLKSFFIIVNRINNGNSLRKVYKEYFLNGGAFGLFFFYKNISLTLDKDRYVLISYNMKGGYEMGFDNLPEVVTIKQLAEFLQVSDQTIKRAIKARKLKAFKIGKDWRIQKDNVILFLNQNSNETIAQSKNEPLGKIVINVLPDPNAKDK